MAASLAAPIAAFEHHTWMQAKLAAGFLLGSASQTRKVMSLKPPTIRLPAGENCTLDTLIRWYATIAAWILGFALAALPVCFAGLMWSGQSVRHRA